MSYQTKQQIGF